MTRRTRRRLTDGACTATLVASDTTIKAALEPVQLLDGMGKGGCDVSSRSTVQPFCLDQPGTGRGVSERPSKVRSGLDMIVGSTADGSLHRVLDPTIHAGLSPTNRAEGSEPGGV